MLKNIVLEKGSQENMFTLEISELDLTTDRSDRRKLPLMGKTGAGKSTLLNLMSAMELPSQGSVCWTFPREKSLQWGKSGLSSGDAKRLRRQYIGFAFQDSTLIPHLNVIDNLCYPLQLSHNTKCVAREKSLIALNKVIVAKETVKSLMHKFPAQLSGGQRQRVALIQAMLHNPHVLFADEPTGSLDIETRLQVMNVLHEWVDEVSAERALFWVTHHEDDPKNAGVSRRLWVNAGKCCYENVISESTQ